jgi:predicted dehydrogenase
MRLQDNNRSTDKPHSRARRPELKGPKSRTAPDPRVIAYIGDMTREPGEFTVGIIGTGIGVRTHASGFSSLPGVRILGIVGSSTGNAKRLLDASGIDPSLACSFDDLLQARPNLIALTTAPNERLAYIPHLAACDSAILAEKPLSPDAPSARVIYEDLLARPRPTFLNTQLRGLPAIRAISRDISDNALGEIYGVSVRERSSTLLRDNLQDWRQRVSTGGGQRLDVGPHLLDLGLYLSQKTYQDAVRCKNSAYGHVSNIPTPTLSTDGARPVFDNVFTGSIKVDDCQIQLSTTGIDDNQRALEFDILGADGVLRFSFRDGRGKMLVTTRGNTSRFILDSAGKLMPSSAEPTKLGPSLFRLAFAHYAQDMVSVCSETEANGAMATISDGVASMDILDHMNSG